MPTTVDRTGKIARLAAEHPHIVGVVVVGVAAALFVVLSLPALREESPTYDEPYHLAAGYTHLVRRDFRLAPDHPPLATTVGSLPLLLSAVRWPPDGPLWADAEEVCFAHALFYQSGNDPERLLRRGREMIFVWIVIILAVVFAWARELYGLRGGLLALSLATISPTVLAHGHLFTTDVAVAALVLSTLWAFARLSSRSTLSRALASGALLGAALTTKFSALFLVPALIAAELVVRWARRAESAVTAVAATTARGGDAGRRPATLAVVLAVVAGAYATIWAAYGFRYRASSDAAFAFRWQAVRSATPGIDPAIDLLRRTRLVPEAWIHGFALVHQRTRDRPSYALGRFSADGWWWYFPFAFLVKTPAAAVLLYLWALWAVVRAGRAGIVRTAYLVIPLVVYWLAAVATPLNIGIRHLLPALPPMMILAGAVPARAVRARWRPVAALPALLLVAAATESLLAAPYHLAFFNWPSRAFFDRHEMLVDSNLDWGQDLGRLARFVREHDIPLLKLSYFGSASPRHLGLAHEVLTAANTYLLCERDLVGATSLAPGDWVAISATNLVGAPFPAADRDALAGFRHLVPETTIGHSIRVYRIPAAFGAQPTPGAE